ncbi:hypothetical protein GCM10009648_40910 [Tsukamurella spumae]
MRRRMSIVKSQSVTVVLIVASIAVGCSHENQARSRDEAVPGGRTSSPAEITSSKVPSFEIPHGVITSSEVAYNDQGPVRIGVIDPDSGEYRSLFSFAYSSSERFSFQYQDGRPSIDPTAERIALTIQGGVGGVRFGWINRSGDFTEVTPKAERGDDFGGGTTFSTYGFDGVGDYYFSSVTDGNRAIYRVPAGQTKAVSAPYDQFPNGENFVTRPDGSYSFLLADLDRYSCIRSNSAPWVGAAGYITLGAAGFSDQLYFNTTLNGECNSGRRELLPETNKMRVFNPVSSPDGAWVLVRGNGSIYRVAIDGKSRPTKVEAPGFGANGSEVLVRWVR